MYFDKLSIFTPNKIQFIQKYKLKQHKNLLLQIKNKDNIFLLYDFFKLIFHKLKIPLLNSE